VSNNLFFASLQSCWKDTISVDRPLCFIGSSFELHPSPQPTLPGLDLGIPNGDDVR